MSQSQNASLKVQARLVTRLFLSPKLTQNLNILSFNMHDLTMFVKDFVETNPFTSLKAPKNELQNLDWIENQTQENLVDYLLKQIRLSSWSSKQQKACIFLVYQLDNDGYFRVGLENILDKTEFSLDYLKQSLKKLQTLEPTGIAARNLNECLLLQAKRILDFNKIALDLLENNQLETLADPDSWENLSYSSEEIKQALIAIRTLDPVPASEFAHEDTQYLIPDLKYEFTSEGLIVRDSWSNLPTIVFDDKTYQELKNNSSKKDREYFFKQKQDFKTINYAIKRRSDTLIKLGQYVGQVQVEYLKTFKKENLKTLSLKQVADHLNLAISTISRAVKDKYVECNGKIFSLRILFSRPTVKNSSVNEIEYLLKDFISKEDKEYPLSDEEICSLFEEKDISVSRRLVAKYRKKLGIANSYQRKIQKI